MTISRKSNRFYENGNYDDNIKIMIKMILIVWITIKAIIYNSGANNRTIYLEYNCKNEQGKDAKHINEGFIQFVLNVKRGMNEN